MVGLVVVDDGAICDCTARCVFDKFLYFESSFVNQVKYKYQTSERRAREKQSRQRYQASADCASAVQVYSIKLKNKKQKTKNKQIPRKVTQVSIH